MSLSLALVLVIAHFVGDFICQSDWMALNKSTRWDALAMHVGAYTLVLGLAVAFSQCDFERGSGVDWFVCVNAAAHFVQDAITSRINARLWFFQPTNCGGRGPAPEPHFVARGGNRHWFFVGIGADQLLHYITLFVTASWWVR